MPSHRKSLHALSHSGETSNEIVLPCPLSYSGLSAANYLGWTETLSSLDGQLPNISEGDSVLEFNCEFGKSRQWVLSKGAQYIGVDSSPLMLHGARMLKDGPGVEYYPLLQDSLSRLKERADFGLVCCSSEEWSLNDLGQILGFFSVCLKNGGAIAGILPPNLHSVERMSTSVIKEAKRSGFEGITFRECTTDMGPVTLMSASLNK